jgi:hypothetical protein
MSKRQKRETRRERKPDAEQWLIELWGVHQAMRTMGFRAEDIWVGYGDVLNVGPDMLFVSLRTQDKEFVYTVIKIPGETEEKVFERWGEFVNEMVASDNEHMVRVYRSSQLGANLQLFFDLIATLAKRGFEVPELPEGMGGVAALFGHEMPPLKSQGDA